MAEPRLSDYTRRVLIAAGVVLGTLVIVFFIWQLARVILLLFGGVLLAVVLSGMTNPLAHYVHIPRGAAMALVVLVILGALVAFGFLAGPRLANQGGELTERVPEAVEQLQERVTEQEWAQPFLEGDSLSTDDLSSESNRVAGGILGAFSTVASTLTSTLVVVILGLYFAFKPSLYTRSATRLVPRERRRRVGQVMGAMGYALRWWMVGRAASMVVVGILTSVGLLVAGIPLFFSLGVIAGLLSFVPYIGPIAGAIPAMLVAVTVDPSLVLYVILLFLGIQLLESYLVTPLIQDRTVSIPPAVLIGAQVIAGVLAGALGILLATPLAVTITVAVQMLYVEDVLGEPVEVLGEAEAVAVQQHAADDIV